MNGTKRMRGTIGLVNPTEGNFSEHRRWEPKPGTQYMRLPHGRVSVSDNNVRMNLFILRDEAQQMRHRQGVVNGSVGNMLATWKKRKYIEPVGEEMTGDQQGRQQYAKTEAYLKKR